MKHYSYLQSISYDVIILVRYDQGKGSDCVILKFFILWGLGFEMHKIFRTCHKIYKLGFAGFSIFEVIRIIEFVQANGYLCAIN